MDDIDRCAIGLRLRRARADARLTQGDVAAEMRISRQAVSAWEVGKAMPTLLEFRAIVELYGASAEHVLFGEGIADSYAEVVTKAMSADFEPSAFGGA